MKSIILAGGVGTRLWPLSREYYPKQFIQMDGLSLFQRTFKRAARLSGNDGIYVVTNEIHHYLVRNQIEEFGFCLPEAHLLAEPAGKNTLPAITWAMQRVRADDPLATAVVFPSDHLLGDTALDQIRAAEPLASKYLVTFGVRPTSPHTGYGYIKPGKPLLVGGFICAAPFALLSYVFTKRLVWRHQQKKHPRPPSRSPIPPFLNRPPQDSSAQCRSRRQEAARMEN